MKENILIEYNSFADPAQVAAFRDTLTDELQQTGSDVTIAMQRVRPFHLGGQQFRVTWNGTYEFQSEDGLHSFSAGTLKVQVQTTDLNFETYQKLRAGRSQGLAIAYQKAMKMILDVAANTESGAINSNVTRELLRAAVVAFPRNT